MKDYVRTDITLQPWNEDIADFLAAMLGDIGYESFTRTEPVLTAYIERNLYNRDTLASTTEQFPAPGVNLSYTETIVEGQDWNHEWEKHYFHPIVIADRCVVRSSFHTDAPKGEYEILVDPKMAFGTGHHSTTRLMLEYLLDHDLRGRTLIDMGTGTGILAILACMRGAAAVYGIEIDPDAYANACDNALLNSVEPRLICGDAAALGQLPQCDIMLANINRNIIVADLESYIRRIRKGGKLICSGFYLPDLDIISTAAAPLGLRLDSHTSDNGWIRAEFSAF